MNENLKMSSALLSRFDLVFILLDSPNVLKDQLLSEHIIAVSGNSSLHEMQLYNFQSFHFNFLSYTLSKGIAEEGFGRKFQDPKIVI